MTPLIGSAKMMLSQESQSQLRANPLVGQSEGEDRRTAARLEYRKFAMSSLEGSM